ncbi:hypothetical protein [Streptomyces sp. RFCAC02]|uniref:hypothetical protein n=1 Tax=Streptomyces sp. RFCAC02 TaxID=2499143 RepID=UPI0019D1C001|nr:hypothetical protein [Streptomyces sp. RFCAC02]
MEIVVAGVLALTLLVFVTLVVRGVRTVRRGVERARQEVSRTLAGAALAARAAQPGALGDVARVRRDLRLSMDSTRAALRASAPTDPALGEALALFAQLEDHAHQLDGELAALGGGEPDRARVTARLPELRERTDRARRSADALRFAAQDRARRHGAEDADALHERIGMEAEALRHWTPVGETPAPVEPGEERPGLTGRFRKRRS